MKVKSVFWSRLKCHSYSPHQFHVHVTNDYRNIKKGCPCWQHTKSLQCEHTQNIALFGKCGKCLIRYILFLSKQLYNLNLFLTNLHGFNGCPKQQTNNKTNSVVLATDSRVPQQRTQRLALVSPHRLWFLRAHLFRHQHQKDKVRVIKVAI